MKIYPLALAMAAVALLLGCSREETPAQPAPPITDASPVPLTINVGVDIPGTRASVVTGEAFANEQRINVILVDLLNPAPDKATPEYPSMSPYVCSITKEVIPVTTWAPVDPTKTPIVVVQHADVLAHYPAVLPNASALSADRRTLQIDIPAEIPYGELGDLNFSAVQMKIDNVSTEVWFATGDEDYMTGYGGTVSAAPSDPYDPTTAQNKTTIAMKHALAMVVVQFTMEASNPDRNKTIDGLWVKNANSATGPLQTGSVNLANNAFTPSGTRIDYSRQMSRFPIAANYYFGLLTYPATINTLEGATEADLADDVEIVCIAGAARYVYKVPKVTWEAGKVYLYTLTLTPASGVLSDGVRLVDWPASADIEVGVE